MIISAHENKDQFMHHRLIHILFETSFVVTHEINSKEILSNYLSVFILNISFIDPDTGNGNYG